jgi:hypothetical protein
MQHITYNEFLPMVLGKEVMEKNQVSMPQQSFVTNAAVI